MNDRIAQTSAGTIGWVAASTSEAERQAAQLRAAGFADVRLSERSGTTSETHVPADEGLTASDFVATLEAAGFDRSDARALTDSIERGGILVTLAAAEHAQTALAVLRGERVRGRAVAPVDVRVSPASATAAAVDPDAEIPPSAATSAPMPAAAAPGDAAETPAYGATPQARSIPEDVEIAGVVPLREERLDISKPREQGEARVRKEIVTEQRTITVPVQREELVIERDGEADVRVPLREEDPSRPGAR